MSYKSKETITRMIVGVLIAIAYTVYALGKNAPDPQNLSAWAIAILVAIGAGIAALIIVEIVFHIAVSIGIAVKESSKGDKYVERFISSTMAEDEMDKIITLKSSHVLCSCCGLGFIGSLVALALGASAHVSLHIMFAALYVGSLIGGGMDIYHYERGIHNG